MDAEMTKSAKDYRDLASALNDKFVSLNVAR